MVNNPSETILDVHGLRFPPAFVKLWTDGQWQQPDDGLIQSLIPWLQGPIELMEMMQWIVTENQGVFADNPDDAKLMHEYRGSVSSEKPDLPWLDVEKALVIAVNREPGDDLAIALDFRTSADDPRVVASYWCCDRDIYYAKWRMVTSTLSEFLIRLQMIDSKEVTT